MKIETEYDIGQEVWVMKDNRPQKFTIDSLIIYKSKVKEIKEMFVIYELYNLNRPLRYSENNLFPTKEELLKACRI